MPITREFMHGILGISEAWELPNALMSAMLDDTRRDALLALVADATEDMAHDGLTDYFQNEHGDRDSLKQDFTPQAVCDLVAGMAGSAGRYIDVCAGTGGLTISLWASNKSAHFRCEEFSARTIPALLMNAAMRNMSAEIVRRDVLTGETFESYVLTPTDVFSRVERVDSLPDGTWDICVQNPPYSLKWDGINRAWMRHGTAPKSKADYAFVEYGLSRAPHVVSILPHGVLFRGAAEGRIRESMLRRHVVRSVVGLPEKLFAHTGIPVAVLDLMDDDGCDGSDGSVCVVNADELYEHGSKQNVMSPNHVRDVLSCLSMRLDVDRLCHIADASEIERNGFNLNIPRYVDRYVEPDIPDVASILADLTGIERELRKTERGLQSQIRRLVGTTEETRDEVRMLQERMSDYVEAKGGQLAWRL